MAEQQPPVYLDSTPQIFVLLATSGTVFLMVLSYTVTNIALPYIAGSFGVSSDSSTDVITFFAAGNAITLPITGFLVNRFGRIRVMLVSNFLFFAFNLLCGLSPNFSTIIAGRFIQGLVSGPLMPLAQSLLVTTSDPKRHEKLIAILSSIAMLAPGLGPLMGGYFSYNYSWRWIFFIVLPIPLFTHWVVTKYLKKSFETKAQKIPFDWLGFSLLIIGVISLQYLLERGQQFDWLKSPMILSLMATALISFTLLVVWNWSHPYPILALQTLKKPTFAISLVFLGLSLSVLYGIYVLMPMWLSVVMHYTPVPAGLLLLPTSILPILLTPLCTKFLAKFGPLISLAICYILMSVGCFYVAYFFNNGISFYQPLFYFVIIGLANAIFFAPLLMLSIRELNTEDMASATGFFYFVRAMAGGIGTSVFVTLWQRRSYAHHEIIGYNIVAGQNNTTAAFNQMHSIGLNGSQSYAVANTMLNSQANTVAFLDCFYLMAIVILAAILILPLGRVKQ